MRIKGAPSLSVVLRSAPGMVRGASGMIHCFVNASSVICSSVASSTGQCPMPLNDSSSWICSVCLTFYITFRKSDMRYIFLVNILVCKTCTCKNPSIFVKMIQGIFLSLIGQLYSEITFVLAGLLDLKPIVKVILLVYLFSEKTIYEKFWKQKQLSETAVLQLLSTTWFIKHV